MCHGGSSDKRCVVWGRYVIQGLDSHHACMLVTKVLLAPLGTHVIISHSLFFRGIFLIYRRGGNSDAGLNEWVGG
jgi:hypothetical protein